MCSPKRRRPLPGPSSPSPSSPSLSSATSTIANARPRTGRRRRSSAWIRTRKLPERPSTCVPATCWLPCAIPTGCSTWSAFCARPTRARWTSWHSRGFVLHHLRIVPRLLRQRALNRGRLLAELDRFQHLRLFHGHLAELIVGQPKIEQRGGVAGFVAGHQGELRTQLLVGFEVHAFLGFDDAGDQIGRSSC